MSIEFTEQTLGVWYVALEGKDWLCGVTRVGEDRFEFQYRIRYYVDPVDPWDGKDRKSWFEGTFTGPRDQVIHNMRRMGRGVIVLAGGAGKLYECVRRLDESCDDFMERFSKMPFVHMKKATEEEYREYRETGKLPKS
jgi:hypothetical protein